MQVKHIKDLVPGNLYTVVLLKSFSFPHIYRFCGGNIPKPVMVGELLTFLRVDYDAPYGKRDPILEFLHPVHGIITIGAGDLLSNLPTLGFIMMEAEK